MRFGLVVGALLVCILVQLFGAIFSNWGFQPGSFSSWMLAIALTSLYGLFLVGPETTKTDPDTLEEEDMVEGLWFNKWGARLAILAFYSLIVFSTPLWDSKGYCLHQYEWEPFHAITGELTGSRTTNKTDECNSLGGWSYSSPMEKAAFFIMIIINLAIFSWIFYGHYDRRTGGNFFGGSSEDKREEIEIIFEKAKDLKVENTLKHRPFLPVAKLDYVSYFERLGKMALEPKNKGKLDTQEVIEILQWAKDRVPTLYSKSDPMGNKRIKNLSSAIAQLQNE